ncbi:hypothetical protein [Microbacterium sp. HSID17254]|uniref:hypothetical protein n=1 Tax=Microbacterium sp. HSID17254 TaxID=2419509 RepID=UPI0012933090|nr:hypothetical protein [Microbacterium sp. HSID17254]
MHDSLPLWFWLPTAIFLWTALLIACCRSRIRDPHRDLSRLDRLDGITDRPRR